MMIAVPQKGRDQETVESGGTGFIRRERAQEPGPHRRPARISARYRARGLAL